MLVQLVDQVRLPEPSADRGELVLGWEAALKTADLLGDSGWVGVSAELGQDLVDQAVVVIVAAIGGHSR